MQSTGTEVISMATQLYAAIEKLEWIARDMRRDADEVDSLAAAVDEWAKTFDPATALGLMERAQSLTAHAEQFVQSDLFGRNTRAGLRNEASIALGASNGFSARGRGDLGYALMHALSAKAKYPTGGYAASGIAVKASSLRVYAAELRVVAGLVDDLRTGKIGGIG